jgi:hypothetical protein
MKISKGLIVIIVVLGVFVYTNPDDDKHKTEVKQLLYGTSLEETINNGDDYAILGTAIGMGLASNIVDQMVVVDNYIVFSITKLRKGNETKLVGFGVLGNIYFTDEAKENMNSYNEIKIDQELLDKYGL